MAKEYLHVDVVEIVKETPAAFLLLLEDENQIWVPKSLIADADDYNEGDKDAVVSIEEWWCDKEGVE